MPWTGDLLVKNTPVFTCKELSRPGALAIGRTETHVVVRLGSWTLYLEIETEARYPNVDDILPGDVSATARLKLDPEDAAFLLPALDLLPGAGEEYAPATLDLNGQVAIRARACDQEHPTELVLSRSSYTGSPIRIHTNRMYLARAIRLGFSDFVIADARSPVACRDGVRAYGWQPLSAESVIEPSDDVTRVESPASTTSPTPTARTDETPKAPKVRPPVSAHARQPKNEPKSDTVTDDQLTPERSGSSVTGLAALIQEAESVHETLAAAKTRTKQLVVALRKHRRHERLVATTLASLKELKLQEVSG